MSDKAIMPSTIVYRIKNLKLRHLLLMSVGAAEILTALIVSGMSLLFWGRVTPDYLMSGAVTSMLVATVVVSLILVFLRDMRITERHLRKSEEKFRSLYSAMSEGVCLHEILRNHENRAVDYRILDVNPAYVSIMGLAREQAIGLKASALYGTEEPPCLDIYAKVADTGNPVAFETLFPPINKHFRVSVFSPESGKFATVFTDITERKQAEKALAASEERYRDLFENASDLIHSVSPEGRFLYVNRAWLNALGYNESELATLSLPDVVAPESRHHCMDVLNRVLSGEEVDKVEAVFLSKSGKRIVVEGGVNRKMQDGVPVSTRAIFRDITHRKRMEQALREGEERYRGIIENIQEGYYESDLAGNLVFFSEPICRIFGYTREELLGTNIRRFADPSAREAGYRVFNQVFTTGVPAKGFDWEMMRKDGTKAHVEASVSLLKDAEGRVTGFSGIIRDITDRKRVEEALRQSEERARAILNAITETLVLVDRKGTVLAANEIVAERLKTTIQDFVGCCMYDFFTPELAESRRRTVDEVIRTARPLHTEDEREGRIYNTHWYPVFSSKGDTEQIAIFAADITETRRLQAQLQQAQKMEAIGTLAGGIAHNFNNLLMAIQGNASLMLMDTHADHPHYKRLKSIEQQVENGSKLTTQLLGYAREGSYEIGCVNLNELVEETSAAFAQARKDIRIHRELDEHLLGVIADQGQIEQVLLNLYVNAADAMHLGGDLFLKTTKATRRDLEARSYPVKPGEYVLLTVRDTGTGMDRKTMERIFEPFFTTKGLGKGTGLGLASVYGIVKAHGGYIDVTSRTGNGSSFQILLPASEKGIPPGKTRASPELPKGRGTVLIVDDEDMIVRIGQDILKAIGYESLVARSGREAIELYRENQGDISMVLLDMIMPDMGGGTTYDRLKKVNPDVKVLLSSGYSLEGQAKEIMARGCNGFIQKPFKIEDLSRKIARILGAN